MRVGWGCFIRRNSACKGFVVIRSFFRSGFNKKFSGFGVYIRLMLGVFGVRFGVFMIRLVVIRGSLEEGFLGVLGVVFGLVVFFFFVGF